MKFKSYSEIENLYNNKFLASIRLQKFDDPSILYVCENKIDGSNFQCSIDEEGNFLVGTRTRILGRDDSFQGYERAMRNEDVKNKLIKMKDLIKEDFSNKNIPEKFILTVYGELCGGMYRHPDVEKVKGAVRIQGRIDYHPDNMWVPFDIAIRVPDEYATTLFLLSQDDVVKYCNKVELPHMSILFRGTLNECLKYPLDFIDKTGNELWGLPVIEKNISEGVVIKPNEPLWLHNGARVIIKNKTEKFKERKSKEPKEAKEIIPMNELELKYYNIAREYITESRLMSVISKVGQINNKQFGLLLGMFMTDLWKDFDKEYKDEIENLNNTLTVDEFNFSKARKELAKEVAEFIRPTFITLINN